MISLRVLILGVLTMKGLHCVRANHGRTEWRRTPISFSYSDGAYLNVYIVLQNIPPGANKYALYYQSGNCEDWPQTNAQCSVTDSQPETGVIPKDLKIPIKKELIADKVWFNVQLLSDHTICSTKRLLDGARVPKERIDKLYNPFGTACLNRLYDTLCEITVDFSNPAKKKFEEQTPPRITCTLNDKRLTCEVNELTEDTVQQWYQRSSDGSFIGTIPVVTGRKTKFKLWLQKFDDGSYIFGKFISKRWNLNLTTEKYKISLPYENYAVKHMKTYSEFEPVSFKCTNDARAQVGWIDPTGYRITTYGKANQSLLLSKSDNGSMFCCLRYETNKIRDEMIITRYVEEVTVLRYQYMEPVDQDSATTSDTKEQINSTSTSSTTPGTSNVTSSPTSNATSPPTSKLTPLRASTDESNTKVNTSPPVLTQEPTSTENLMTTIETNLTISVQDQTSTNNPLTDEWNGSSDKTKYFVAIASAAGIILLVSLIYVIVKKCTRKASDPEEMLQLETYASTNMVYAELDIRPSNAPPSATTADTTYAEIIGVLGPMNEMAKNKC